MVEVEYGNCFPTDPPIEGELENSNKVSLNNLEGSFKDLDSQQVKDTLSSFLPHIPGEFDRMPDTMLRQLLEQRTIGGKEFSPLSGQALLGFRLLPGPVSAQYSLSHDCNTAHCGKIAPLLVFSTIVNTTVPFGISSIV